MKDTAEQFNDYLWSLSDKEFMRYWRKSTVGKHYEPLLKPYVDKLVEKARGKGKEKVK
jgi:hypothetical protein